jgi:hypothetical protein
LYVQSVMVPGMLTQGSTPKPLGYGLQPAQEQLSSAGLVMGLALYGHPMRLTVKGSDRVVVSRATGFLVAIWNRGGMVDTAGHGVCGAREGGDNAFLRITDVQVRILPVPFGGDMVSTVRKAHTSTCRKGVQFPPPPLPAGMAGTTVPLVLKKIVQACCLQQGASYG